MWEISEYSIGGKIISVILLIHNVLTVYYTGALQSMYYSNCVRNMHAVEDMSIGNLYDKARYHKIDFGKQKKFYFTRSDSQGNSNLWANVSEMMSSGGMGDSPLRWILPLPHFNRQDYSDILNGKAMNSKEVQRRMGYMKFDMKSLKDLIVLEYQIEKKIEDDLIQSGFKIKRKILIPKHLS